MNQKECLSQLQLVAKQFPLIAGQHNYAGYAEIYYDNEFLYVNLISEPGYTISESHLFVGTLDDVPVNKKEHRYPGIFHIPIIHQITLS